MRNIARITLSLIFAFIFFSILEKISFSAILLFNVLSLVVIYFSMEMGEKSGMFLGMICGLIHDSFSFGIFGLSGIAKTITGFLAGFIAKRINVVYFHRNFIYIFVLILIELTIWGLLYTFLLSERVNTGNGILFFQPLGTAILGSVFFLIIRKIKKKRSVNSDER